MDCTQCVSLPVRRTRDGADSGSGWDHGSGHVALQIEVVVQQGHGVDGRDRMRRLRLGAILEDDLVGGLRHLTERGVLERSCSGIGRQGVDKDDLEESLDIREEAGDVVKELCGQLVTNRSGLT